MKKLNTFWDPLLHKSLHDVQLICLFAGIDNYWISIKMLQQTLASTQEATLTPWKRNGKETNVKLPGQNKRNHKKYRWRKKMTKGGLLQKIGKTQSIRIHWHGSPNIFSTNSWFVTTANTASLKPSSSSCSSC